MYRIVNMTTRKQGLFIFQNECAFGPVLGGVVEITIIRFGP